MLIKFSSKKHNLHIINNYTNGCSMSIISTATCVVITDIGCNVNVHFIDARLIIYQILNNYKDKDIFMTKNAANSLLSRFRKNKQDIYVFLKEDDTNCNQYILDINKLKSVI